MPLFFGNNKIGSSVLPTEVKFTNPVLQSKIVTPSTNSKVVTPDNGYDGLSQVTVNAIQTVQQAIPRISISSNGEITAKSTQNEGYVFEGVTTAYEMLDTQETTIITPSVNNQIAVKKGIYTTGTITVEGDENLIAENIKHGVSIFGVSGNFEGSGNGGSAVPSAEGVEF